jgi:hypothetical protein
VLATLQKLHSDPRMSVIDTGPPRARPRACPPARQRARPPARAPARPPARPRTHRTEALRSEVRDFCAELEQLAPTIFTSNMQSLSPSPTADLASPPKAVQPSPVRLDWKKLVAPCLLRCPLLEKQGAVPCRCMPCAGR